MSSLPHAAGGPAAPNAVAAAGPVAAASAPRLRHSTVEDWVRGWFLPVFSWRVDGQRWFWCRQWWRHPEVIWRLESLWRSWEAARLQPTGMSTWALEVDRQLPLLLGADSPMRQCRDADGDRPARHTEPSIATTDPAPADWWSLPGLPPG